MSECTRREFVVAGAAACAAALWTLRGTVVLADDGKEKIDVGEVSQFKEDGAVDTWTTKHRFFIVRQGDKLFAVSATCTHKGSLIRIDEDDSNRYFCPKHEGTFELTGKRIRGKPRSSLPRLGITLDPGNNHVIVDPAREFPEAEWDRPESFVAIPV